MRTTLDLPDDLHALTVAIAKDAGASLSETVARLLRGSLTGSGSLQIQVSGRTGLAVVHGGGVTTSENVRSLDDDE